MILERNIPILRARGTGADSSSGQLARLSSQTYTVKQGHTCAANQGSPHTALKGSGVAFKCQPT